MLLCTNFIDVTLGQFSVADHKYIVECYKDINIASVEICNGFLTLMFLKQYCLSHLVVPTEDI